MLAWGLFGMDGCVPDSTAARGAFFFGVLLHRVNSKGFADQRLESHSAVRSRTLRPSTEDPEPSELDITPSLILLMHWRLRT